MELIVDRFKLAPDHTLGRLSYRTWEPIGDPRRPHVGVRKYEIRGGDTEVVRDKFLCFTLEDIYRPMKLQGHTRIPSGRYEIKLRPEGGKYQKYLKRFGLWQEPGMLWITNVPGFEWILIHPGNTPKDTEGCLLVADGYFAAGSLDSSSPAYERIYKLIAERLLKGEKVFITYEDNDR